MVNKTGRSVTGPDATNSDHTQVTAMLMSLLIVYAGTSSRCEVDHDFVELHVHQPNVYQPAGANMPPIVRKVLM